jgi:hypothetical protein
MSKPEIKIKMRKDCDIEDGKPIFDVEIGNEAFVVCSIQYQWRQGVATPFPIGHGLQIWPDQFNKDKCATTIAATYKLRTWDTALPQQWLEQEAWGKSGIKPSDNPKFHEAYFGILAATVWAYYLDGGQGPLNTVRPVVSLLTEEFHRLAEARKW